MKLLDIHTHLSCPDYDQDREDVLHRALETCDLLIDIGAGTSADACRRAQALSEKVPEVFFTAGIHPHDASTSGKDEPLLSEISKALTHGKCVAVGECGLDYYYKNSSREDQINTFQWHINQAQKLNMPLMIHTRDAEADTMSLLNSYNGLAVFHCFTGTQELASFGIDKGFFISFSGIVTFKNASSLRDVYLKTPLENILIETDSPYLAPVPMRGKRNESSFVKHTFQFLAELRGIPVAELNELVHENARRLFSKIESS